MRTNVTRLLDAHQIPYTPFFLPDEKRSAVETAELLGVDPDAVFKSIVVMRTTRGKPILAVIPGPASVDLKALAKETGEKKLRLATLKEAEALTGLQTGGISPLALTQQGFEIIIDAYATVFEHIHISGGHRGVNVFLPVAALLQLTQAHTATICTL